MLDWDYNANEFSIGSVTAYTLSYGDDMKESRFPFNLKDLDPIIEELREMKEDIIEKKLRNGNDGEMIGLNSNSFIPDNDHEHKNHLFLEWDTEHGIPPVEALKSIGGILIKTGRGYHVIKEDCLSREKLAEEQTKHKCCPSFVKYTLQKGYSTLRVTPKNDTKLDILIYRDGLIYNVYKELIEKLGG